MSDKRDFDAPVQAALQKVFDAMVEFRRKYPIFFEDELEPSPADLLVESVAKAIYKTHAQVSGLYDNWEEVADQPWRRRQAKAAIRVIREGAAKRIEQTNYPYGLLERQSVIDAILPVSDGE